MDRDQTAQYRLHFGLDKASLTYHAFEILHVGEATDGFDQITVAVFVTCNGLDDVLNRRSWSGRETTTPKTTRKARVQESVTTVHLQRERHTLQAAEAPHACTDRVSVSKHTCTGRGSIIHIQLQREQRAQPYTCRGGWAYLGPSASQRRLRQAPRRRQRLGEPTAAMARQCVHAPLPATSQSPRSPCRTGSQRTPHPRSGARAPTALVGQNKTKARSIFMFHCGRAPVEQTD